MPLLSTRRPDRSPLGWGLGVGEQDCWLLRHDDELLSARRDIDAGTKLPLRIHRRLRICDLGHLDPWTGYLVGQPRWHRRHRPRHEILAATTRAPTHLLRGSLCGRDVS